MTNVHIVGEKHSFTFIACHSRYVNGYVCVPHTHAELVAGLLNASIPKDEASVVPLWNSNVGTVDMDKQTKTAKIFLGEAGNILDLWPEEIVLELGVSGQEELLREGDIYSVHVAHEQCSKFLKINGAYETDRFKGEDTTTLAADSFRNNSIKGDGLLCSNDLLSDCSLNSQGNRANPYNFTVFSTINVLPRAHVSSSPVYSLAAVLVNLNGDRLPIDFTNYWRQLFPEHEAESTEAVIKDIPKIMFIIRYEEAKALLLMEMPSSNLAENPWPVPESDLEPGAETTNNLVSLNHVGGIHESYIETEKALFINKFKVGEEEIIFYSNKGTFIWGSPALNIFVHGFDPFLVKECVRLQINRLIQLMDYGITMPVNAVTLLNLFIKDPNQLGLAPESQPDTP